MSDHVPAPEPQARAEARRERLRELMDRLERALAEPALADLPVWRTNVALVCDELDGALHDHVEETEGDLFPELERTSPHVVARIARLTAEHPRLRAELDDLREALVTDAPEPETTAERIRERALALLTDLLRHRQSGADLLYEAYWVDLASAD
ncbi:hemerythrin domain-containing protein [Actinomarinicola tropica]|nr:hemerythrin domain-containing protein [Actinomarinicola tropica]